MTQAYSYNAVNNLRQTLSRGLLWQYSSVAVQAVAQLAVLSTLSRLLSPEDFGLLSAAMIFVGFAGLFGQLGVAPAIVYTSELTARVVRAGFTLSIIAGVLLTGLLWALAPIFGKYFGNDQVVPVVRAVAVIFPIAGLGAVSDALLQRRLKFNVVTLISVISYVLGYGAIAIWLGASGAGVWALVAGTIGQRTIQTVASYVLAPHPVRPLVSIAEYRKLLHYGIGHTSAEVLNYAANQGDYLVVGRVFDPATLGLYSRAYQLMMLPVKYLGQALDAVLFPVMSRVRGDPDRLKSIYLGGTAAISLLVCPAGAMMVVLAPEIVQLLLGRQWTGAVVPFQVLALGLLFRTTYKLSDSLAKACGAVYKRSAREALYAALVVLGSIIGARWGVVGVAGGVLVAIITNYVVAALSSVGLLGIRLTSYFAVQLGGACLGIIVGLVAIMCRFYLNDIGLRTMTVLLVVSAMGIGTAAAVAMIRPALLGPTGAELVAMIRAFFHNRVLGFRDRTA